MPDRMSRPTIGGFQELVLHSAPGVLAQHATVDEEVRKALLKARTVELVRPYHGVVVHGDMSGDLGAVYPDAPRPDLTAVATAAVLRAAGRQALVQDGNTGRQPYEPAPADVRLVKIQLATWQADLAFARTLADRTPRVPVALYGATVEHLPDSREWLAIRGDAPTALAGLLDVEDVEIGKTYSIFPLADYRGRDGDVQVHLQASRGCNRTCLYCPYIRTLGRWSGRAPAAIEADAGWLVKLGVRRVQFRDQDFASDAGHAIDVAAAMGRGGQGRLSWSVEGNLDRFSPEVLASMRTGGATEVIVGIESTDPAVLRRARRRVPSDLAEMIAQVRAAGLRVRGLFMVGLPEDSWDRVMASLTTAIELDLDAAQFNAYAPLPGERFGNARIATVHDFVAMTNDFRHRTCESMSQKEIRLARAWASAAFDAHRARNHAVRDHYLEKIRGRGSRWAA